MKLREIHESGTKLGGRIPGGKGEGHKVSDFDPEELDLGTEDEMEHTTDPKIAREIASDHLVKKPHYYSKHEG